MADNTAVNSQITDAVSSSTSDVQASASTPTRAPALSMGSLYQTAAQSAGLAMQNATSAQNNANTVANSVTVQGVNLLYSIGG